MYFNSTTCNEARGFSTYLRNEYTLPIMLYSRCTNYILSISKTMQSDSTTIYVIFINNLIILMIVIFIYLTLQNTMPIAPAYSE